jgi:hypothetical protein
MGGKQLIFNLSLDFIPVVVSPTIVENMAYTSASRNDLTINLLIENFFWKHYAVCELIQLLK